MSVRSFVLRCFFGLSFVASVSGIACSNYTRYLQKYQQVKYLQVNYEVPTKFFRKKFNSAKNNFNLGNNKISFG